MIQFAANLLIVFDYFLLDQWILLRYFLLRSIGCKFILSSFQLHLMFVRITHWREKAAILLPLNDIYHLPSVITTGSSIWSLKGPSSPHPTAWNSVTTCKTPFPGNFRRRPIDQSQFTRKSFRDVWRCPWSTFKSWNISWQSSSESLFKGKKVSMRVASGRNSFISVFSELFENEQLFKEVENHMFWFNTCDSFVDYKFIGILFALAIYNGVLYWSIPLLYSKKLQLAA